jgi:hypothetical protein
MTAKRITAATLLFLYYFLTGSVCSAQTFHGDFLAGLVGRTNWPSAISTRTEDPTLRTTQLEVLKMCR